MKFNCGLTGAEKYAIKKAKLINWHRWFAWRPVRVGKNDCRWLEFVERKLTFDYCSDGVDITAEYRAWEPFYG